MINTYLINILFSYLSNASLNQHVGLTRIGLGSEKEGLRFQSYG